MVTVTRQSQVVGTHGSRWVSNWNIWVGSGRVGRSILPALLYWAYVYASWFYSCNYQTLCEKTCRLGTKWVGNYHSICSNWPRTIHCYHHDKWLAFSIGARLREPCLQNVYSDVDNHSLRWKNVSTIQWPRRQLNLRLSGNTVLLHTKYTISQCHMGFHITGNFMCVFTC